MVDIHIYDVNESIAYTALSCGETFAKQYPDRVGIRNGVVYAVGSDMIYAYRTKSGRIIVRGDP